MSKFDDFLFSKSFLKKLSNEKVFLCFFWQRLLFLFFDAIDETIKETKISETNLAQFLLPSADSLFLSLSLYLSFGLLH